MKNMTMCKKFIINIHRMLNLFSFKIVYCQLALRLTWGRNLPASGSSSFAATNLTDPRWEYTSQSLILQYLVRLLCLERVAVHCRLCMHFMIYTHWMKNKTKSDSQVYNSVLSLQGISQMKNNKTIKVFCKR